MYLMDTYLYTFSCPRWYGKLTGVKNVYFKEEHTEDEVVEILQERSNKLTGSKTCDIKLLQKLKVSIESVKNYDGLATIPLNIDNGEIIEEEEK